MDKKQRDHDQRADDDCLVCCLSYMLGVPYDDIPQFTRDHGPSWKGDCVVYKPKG